MAASPDGRITIENVKQPGKTYRVDARKYEAMHRALLKVLPKKAPGLTVEEMYQAAIVHLPETLFPGGATAVWWLKAVQLDLEAKGVVRRADTKPLRLHKA